MCTLVLKNQSQTSTPRTLRSSVNLNFDGYIEYIATAYMGKAEDFGVLHHFKFPSIYYKTTTNLTSRDSFTDFISPPNILEKNILLLGTQSKI